MNSWKSIGIALFFTFAAQAQILLGGAKNVFPGAEIDDPVSVTIRRTPSPKGDFLTFDLALDMKAPIHIYSAESLFFKVHAAESKGLGTPRVTLPKPKQYRNFDGTVVDVLTGGQTISLSYPISDPRWSVAGFIQYQACDDTKCFLPEKRGFAITSDEPATFSRTLEVYAGGPSGGPGAVSGDWRELAEGFKTVGKTGGYLNTKEFSAFLTNPAGTGEQTSPFAGKNIWLVMALIILGGLALNLTPCVLPMMPITVAILGGGAQAGSRTRGLVMGATYGLAMALAYGALGLFVVLSKTQFGVINSSPVFNGVIALIFVVLALGMFDILHLDFTRFRSGIRQNEKSRGKLVTAFFMGIVAALLAGACVAPAVISAVLYSATLYSQGVKAGLLLPFLLGIGMALPWPFAGAGLSFLPKPGKWMAWVRNAFGVLILVMAAYYAYSGYKIHQQTRVPEGALKQVSVPGDSELPWIKDLAQGLAVGAAEKKPVFVDFWATWCKNCLAMDATTLRDSGIRKQMSKYVLVKYQAENPNDPAIKEVLSKFGVIGLPTYVILEPGSPGSE